ncbi:hypothetical protein C8R45DRAFT_971611 [Mycena sanguinolenta]|nr:hypothetical protein C8R45DRAFT_971611 [Mycena sanguinolenta]
MGLYILVMFSFARDAVCLQMTSSLLIIGRTTRCPALSLQMAALLFASLFDAGRLTLSGVYVRFSPRPRRTQVPDMKCLPTSACSSRS